VTGFGLLGHLRELLAGSGLAGEVDAAAVPVLDGVRALLADGMVAGGTQRNHAFVTETAPVDWGGLPRDEQLLLADAQTSGGLLLAVDPARVDDLVAELERRETLAAAVVARAAAGPAGAIRVRG
jgi:selenide,water dikinase